MTLMSKILAFFPFFHITLIVFSAYRIVLSSGIYSQMILWSCIFVFFLYFFAPFIFRLHQLFFPLQEGTSTISEKQYCPWWGSHQIQMLYIAVPSLENILRIIPGLYSFWLRLWGAQVGKGVYWTPRADILDRPMMVIGNRVVFGQETVFCAHVISFKPEGLKLYLKKIEIGNHCFMGAQSKLSPGVKVLDQVSVRYGSVIWPDTIVDQKLAIQLGPRRPEIASI